MTVDPGGVVTVGTQSGCLAVMDAQSVDAAVADFLHDGPLHEHCDGALMRIPGAVGTMLAWAGPVTVSSAEDGHHVNLLRLDVTGCERVPVDDPHRRFIRDGWSTPVSVHCPSGQIIVGDPARSLRAGGDGAVLHIPWASTGFTVSVFTVEGMRHHIVVSAVVPASSRRDR